MNVNITSKFSIIIPVYDRVDYVRKAVDSCLRQEYDRENIEIIVVKNFLDYDLEAWFRQESVLYVDSDKVNLVDKLIEGISISSGDIICLLEDDDEFVSNKLETLYEQYKNFPNVACLHNNFRYKEENGYRINKFYLKHRKNLRKAILLKKAEKKFALIRHKDVYHNLSCWSIRRNYIFKLLNDLSGLTYNIDFLLYVEVIEQQAEMLILPDQLTIYRRHDSASRIAFDDQKIIVLFESSIFSLQTVKNKMVNRKLRCFIKSNIYIEQFKINIVEEKYLKITDVKDSLNIITYPVYIRSELYPFLFLYLILGIFRKFRKNSYIKTAHILN